MAAVHIGKEMIHKKTIISHIPHTVKTVDIPGLGKKHQGKVRDSYILKNSLRPPRLGEAGSETGKRIIITTDRQSAFDNVLGHIPFKGEVLTQLSAFWFQKTKNIVQNHLITVPDPNVMVVQNCEVIPIEMVVRGYITGVTDTSIWGSYEKGERTIYGIQFPEGLKKNQKLKAPVITPTTKADAGHHDERLTEEEILKKKIPLPDGKALSPALWKQMKKATLAIFAKGQKIADKAGMILVDTKYEFGLYKGKLMLIDEVHTPDSSRYWVKKTYASRFKKGLEPESTDKEPLRIWFKDHGYTGKGKPPVMPPGFIAEMSTLYQSIYEKITGKKFTSDTTQTAEKRIIKNLMKAGFLHG